MPKRYEDEIRDLLKGMHRYPGEVPAPRRRVAWRFPSLAHLDAHRVMGGALILMLFSWILGMGPWRSGYHSVAVLAGYVSLASVILFVVALVMLVRAGAFGRGITSSPREVRWRGKVIEFPRRSGAGASLRRWWRNLAARFSRRPSGPSRPRGRDSYQW